MLATKQRLAHATRDSEREQLQRKCDWLDAEKDKLVYQLYGLTTEEIKVVEGK
jgi:adenine-specific DNA-methyltransferase